MKRKHQTSSIIKSYSSKTNVDTNVYLGNKLTTHSKSTTKPMKRLKKEGCGCGKPPSKAI